MVAYSEWFVSWGFVAISIITFLIGYILAGRLNASHVPIAALIVVFSIMSSTGLYSVA